MTLRTSCASAFTLIEVLLALALSTLLIGAVYWALAAGFDAHRRADRVLSAPRSAELVLESLRADLRGAVRPGGWLAAEFVSLEASSAGGGRVQELVFYTTSGTAGAARTAGVRRVAWTLSEPTDELMADWPAVVRRVTDNLLAPVEATYDEQVLAMEAVELTFRFYDGSAWVDTWDSIEQGDALPVAVEVRLGLVEARGERGGRGGRAAEAALPWGGDGEGVYWVTRVLGVPGARVDEAGAGGGGIRR